MSAITLQFDTAADLESALLDALQNNEGHVSGIAAYLAQTGGEAVAPEAKPEWPNGAFFTDGDGSFYDEQAEPLPGKESRHMDDSELYCPQCNGSGEGREMTTGHGPDDYEYDCPCQLCGGNGSLFRAFEGMKAERDALRQKYNAALARFPVPSLLPAEVEQRTYKDGTQATGTAPLPDKSPAEQERAALSAQAAPEYRTGFDEAPSTFTQEDAAPADYPPLVSKEQLLQDLGYFSPSSARLRDAPEWQRHDRLRRFIEQSGRERVSADPLPRPLLTDLEIQGLRRQARNDPRCADQHWFILMVRAIESYYGVTGAAAQSQPLVEPTADYPPRLADEVERELAMMIDRSPEPLRRLSDWLANKLDEDDWKTAERMLLGAVESVADRVQQHQVKKGEPS